MLAGGMAFILLSRLRTSPAPAGILGVMFHTGDRVLVCTSYGEQQNVPWGSTAQISSAC